VPELLGREAFSHAGYLLSCTERMTVIHGSAQIWSRGAFWARGASVLLADAYPGRYVLGLGVGGGGRTGAKPIAAMTACLDEMDAVTSPNPAPEVPAPRILAAYGPKMLALARDHSAGGALLQGERGPHGAVAGDPRADAFLGVEHAVLFETDPARARVVAREHLATYLAGQYNVAKFSRLGYSEADLASGGSDRFVDDFVFWGDLDAIAERLQEQVRAGADHVGIQVIGISPGQAVMPRWRSPAGALLP
jgi:probable F420-dependent oxidoreductase